MICICSTVTIQLNKDAERKKEGLSECLGMREQKVMNVWIKRIGVVIALVAAIAVGSVIHASRTTASANSASNATVEPEPSSAPILSLSCVINKSADFSTAGADDSPSYIVTAVNSSNEPITVSEIVTVLTGAIGELGSDQQEPGELIAPNAVVKWTYALPGYAIGPESCPQQATEACTLGAVLASSCAVEAWS